MVAGFTFKYLKTQIRHFVEFSNEYFKLVAM